MSPLVQLEVENVEVRKGTRYPQVTNRIAITNIEGEQCSGWLNGLCARQSNIEEFEVAETAAFSDEQLAILSRVRSIKRLSLDSVSVSGTAFRDFKEHSQGLEVTLANCPLSDEGLRMLVECRALQSLMLSFSRSCESIPKLQILLDVSPSVDVYIEIRKECVDPQLAGVLRELDEHFTNFVVHFLRR